MNDATRTTLPRDDAPSDATPRARRPAATKGDDAANLARHRRRQASVAAILDRTFGRLAESNPDLWERRAYLMLMGTVYERLAAAPHDIETDELIALARALAENRRAEARSRDEKSDSPGETERRAARGTELTRAVRDLYGTNFHESGDDSSQ